MERDNLEDLHIDGIIILELVFKKWDGVHGLDSSGLVAGTCECNDEPLGFTKCREFLN
jgi:hypothetical protein